MNQKKNPRKPLSLGKLFTTAGIAFLLAGCTPPSAHNANSTTVGTNNNTTPVTSPHDNATTETEKKQNTSSVPQTTTKPKAETSKNNVVDFEAKIHEEGYKVLAQELYQKIFSPSPSLSTADLEKFRKAVITRYAEIYYQIVSSNIEARTFYENNYYNLTFVDNVDNNSKSGVYITPSGVFINTDAGMTYSFPVRDNGPLQGLGASFFDKFSGNMDITNIQDMCYLLTNTNLVQNNFGASVAKADYGNLNISEVDYYLYLLSLNPSDNTIRENIRNSVCEKFIDELYNAVADSLDGTNNSNMVRQIYQENGNAVKVVPGSYDYPNNFESGLYLFQDGVVLVFRKGNESKQAYWNMSPENLFSKMYDAYSQITGDNFLALDCADLTDYARECDAAKFYGKGEVLISQNTMPQYPYSSNNGIVNFTQQKGLGSCKGTAVFSTPNHTPEQAGTYASPSSPELHKAYVAIVRDNKVALEPKKYPYTGNEL